MVLIPVDRTPAKTTQVPPSTRLLPPGTLVQGKISGRIGVVQHYHPKWNRSGGFPVKFLDHIWEICGADDVTVLEAPNSR